MPLSLTIEQQLNQALAEGDRLQDVVQQILLRALTRAPLDVDGMRKAAAEALGAVREAATQGDAQARRAALQAMRGIESALAQVTRARADMATLEKVFIDELRQAADAARGTPLGQQLQESADLAAQTAAGWRAILTRVVP